jgi:hypothetical protein
MTIFDLVFLLAVLALVITLGTVAFAAWRGRRDRAVTLLRRTAIAGWVYFTTVIAVSIASKLRVVPLGEAQCFDDWCITAVSAVRERGAGVPLRVVVRLSSLARGISQGESDVRVYVVGDRGTRYEAEPETNVIPLSVKIPPQGAVTTNRLFRVPATVRNPLLGVAHGPFPHCCIIGDPESLFHKRTVMTLQ